jgi:hypothetical protein
MINRRDIELLLYPELAAIAPLQRGRALKQAKEEPIELIEWIGILFGLAIAVSVTRYSVVDFGLVDRFAVLFVNFAIAIPLLTVLAGPFLVRRTRRGLRRYLGGLS